MRLDVLLCGDGGSGGGSYPHQGGQYYLSQLGPHMGWAFNNHLVELLGTLNPFSNIKKTRDWEVLRADQDEMVCWQEAKMSPQILNVTSS